MKKEQHIVLVLFFLVGLYFSAIFFLPGSKVPFYVKPLCIPIFLVYLYLKNGFSFPKKYYLFVLFFYLGQLFMLFSDYSNTILQLALVFYVLSYLALANLSLDKISMIYFKKIFTGATFLVILLNAFFLLLTVYIIFQNTSNTITNYIAIVNAISAILVMVCSVVYLSIDMSRKSFYYFLGAIILIVSDVFSALNFYYLYVFVLNVLELLLHFAGFYFIYLFMNEKEKIDEIPI
jgi:hypothetical protein